MLWGVYAPWAAPVAQVLYVAILDGKLRDYIPSYVSAVAREAGLLQSSLPTLLNTAETQGHVYDSVPGMTDTVIEAVIPHVVRAYIEAFRIVLFDTIPFRVVLIISAAYVPDMDSTTL